MKKLLSLLTIVFLSFALVGCAKEEGALEKAGKKADEKIEKTGKSLDKLKKKAKEKLED